MHLGENCSCLPTNLNLTSWKMWCENLENVTVVALLEEPKKASLLSTLQQSLEMKQHHFSNGGPINQMEDRCSNVSKSIPFKVSQYFSIFHIVSNDYILSKKSSWWKHFENSQFGFSISKLTIDSGKKSEIFEVSRLNSSKIDICQNIFMQFRNIILILSRAKILKIEINFAKL